MFNFLISDFRNAVLKTFKHVQSVLFIRFKTVVKIGTCNFSYRVRKTRTNYLYDTEAFSPIKQKYSSTIQRQFSTQ